MLMISAIWLGLERLLWKKGNQTQAVICLEIFDAARRQRLDALLQDSHTCTLLAFGSMIQCRAVHGPAGAQPCPRSCGAARSHADNGRHSWSRAGTATVTRHRHPGGSSSAIHNLPKLSAC